MSEQIIKLIQENEYISSKFNIAIETVQKAIDIARKSGLPRLRLNFTSVSNDPDCFEEPSLIQIFEKSLGDEGSYSNFLDNYIKDQTDEFGEEPTDICLNSYMSNTCDFYRSFLVYFISHFSSKYHVVKEGFILDIYWSKEQYDCLKSLELLDECW